MPSCLFRGGAATCLLLLAVCAAPLAAAQFAVDSTLDLPDVNPGDGLCATSLSPRFSVCTLRAAVQEANALAGFDEVALPAGRFTLTIPGIDEDHAATGDLDVTEHLDVYGVGYDQTIVDGAGLDRVFHAWLGVEFTLAWMTVTGGSTLGPGVGLSGWGGGVLAEASARLRLLYVRVMGNRADYGGGVAADVCPFVWISTSEITGNEGDPVGGLSFTGTGTEFLLIEQSTVSENTCRTSSGGSCWGGIRGFNCDAGDWGMELTDSTVSGNEGNGITMLECDPVLRYSTIYDNAAHGLATVDSHARAVNTILAGSGIQDCLFTNSTIDLDANHNLSSDATCGLKGSDLFNTDPQLYPLGYYSPRPPLQLSDHVEFAASHHPRWYSPVVDAGTDDSFQADQDGYFRPEDGDQDTVIEHDIGSIEVAPCVALVDDTVSGLLVTSGTISACRDLTVGPGVTVDGVVLLEARNRVALTNNVVVNASEVTIAVRRDAGAPP